MLQLIPVLIKIITFTLFSINFSFAQKSVSCENQPSDFLQKKIYEPDSAKEYITAQYCLKYDTDRGWMLLIYEQFIPLVFKVQAKSYKYDFYSSANLEADIKFYINYNGINIGCKDRTSKGLYKCREDIDEEYNIYKYFNTLYSELYSEQDKSKITVLFDKIFTVEWNMRFKIDYQPHSLFGNYNIKISGICTEEQIKKNEGLNE